MIRKISSKLIFAFLLMLAALTVTNISSFISSDTQKQHLIFTEFVSESKLIIERIVFMTTSISESASLNQDEFIRKTEINTSKINMYIDRIDEIFNIFHTHQFTKNGKKYELKFRNNFLRTLNKSMEKNDMNWVKTKELVTYLINKENLNDFEDYKRKKTEFQIVDKDIISSSDHLIDICMKEAEIKRNISTTLQISTSIFSFIIFIFLIFILFNDFYKPIVKTKAMFCDMADGKINQKFERKQQDEFKELYDKFNYFIDNLNFIFSLENKILSEEKSDEILKFIYINFKKFIPFIRLGIVFKGNSGDYYKKEINEQHEIEYNKTDILQTYNAITVENNEIIVPIIVNEVYLGYTFFRLKVGSQIKDSYINFIEIIKDKLSFAYYKIFLFKNLLSIVTESLAKTVEKRDPETGGHLTRMSAYSQIIAIQLFKKGFYKEIIDNDFLDNIRTASPMHDIGKVSIPDNILLKPGKLTDEEFEIMKTHASTGGEILTVLHERFKEYHILHFKIAADIAYGHQEKFNGTGYPKGLKGEEIPLVARITALADVFDALTSKRPYKEAFSLEKSYAIIKELSEIHFDPLVVEAFFETRAEIEKIYNKYKEV